MSLDDPCMPNSSAETRNFVLACYAVSLIKGHTLLGKPVRLATVQHYLKGAYALFTKRNKSLEIKITSTDHIKIITDSLQRYERVKRRRNMITDGMTRWLSRQAKSHHKDSDFSAIVDWVILGRYAGFRKSEWCQSTLDEYERINEWPGKPALAFIRSDFEFLAKDERFLSEEEVLKSPHLIHFVKITFRKQKNKQNGESVTFARDEAHPNYCPVIAALRIHARAIRLKIPDHVPIGMFKGKDGTRQFITDSLVAKYLRQSASAVLNIKKGDDYLSLWSTHSIRVTAANLLHRARFSDSFIQKRLRWRSNSFLDYLRDTTYAADQHSKHLSISENNLPPVWKRTYRAEEPAETLLAPAA